MEKRGKYPITLAVGLALGVAIALTRGFALPGDVKTNCMALSDGWFVMGALVVCLSVLSLASENGIFDTLAYGFHSLLVLFTAFKDPSRHEDFYTYKQRKEAKRKKADRRFLLAGLTLLVAAVIALILYYAL